MRRMRHLKPREVQGCQIALDASIPGSLYDATSGGSLVAADGAVARWEDQSGNARHVTQSTSGLRPLRRASVRMGLDALEFDNTNDRMVNSEISVSLPVTLFAFGQTSQITSVVLDSYNNVQHVVYRGGGGDNAGSFTLGSGGPVKVTDDTLWGGLTAVSTASAGNSITRGRLSVTTGTNATNSLSGISVGNIRGNPSTILSDYAWGGYIAEAAVYSAALSAFVIQRLGDSRSRKWRTDR